MKKFWLSGIVLALAACSQQKIEGIELRDIYINEPYTAPQNSRIEIERGITPQVYAIAASRATNKMLDDTADIYENNGNTFLFISDAKKDSDDIPDGFYKANQVTRGIIENSRTYKVVNNLNDADYFLEARVANVGTLETPVISYRIILFDKNNTKVKEWTETVRRLRNDDGSWW